MDGEGIGAGHPALRLMPDEKRLYDQLFRQADEGGVGVVTGDVAVQFFEKTRLDSRVLGEIWQIADNENRGFLTRGGFDVVLRLIGHAQAGREPTAALAREPSQLPRFDGLFLTPEPAPPPAPPPVVATPPPLAAQGTGGPVRVPPLTPEKAAQYAGLFERQPLLPGGLLPGEQAKQIFEKSGLPNEVLGRIWQLADTEQRGGLVLTEFIIAMHLLTMLKTGQLRAFPNIIPAALYEAATRRGVLATPPGAVPASPPVVAAATGQSVRGSPGAVGVPSSPLSAIPRQLSGSAVVAQHQLRAGSPALGRSPLAAQATGAGPVGPGQGEWAVTPQDKVRFDQLYDGIDKARKGFITGEEAVDFFSKSNLAEDTLAQIWDLADVRSEGRLTRDEFAVAMFLIRQQRQGAAVPLPAVLPPSLIPPSLRPRPPTASGPSPFDAPTPTNPAAVTPPPPPKAFSALDDLLGLDASPPALSALSALSTGGSTAPRDPFATGTPLAPRDPFATSTPLAPGSPAAQPSPSAATFKAFVPTSSFGRSLSNDGPASSTPPPQQQLQQRAFAPPASSSTADDMLGDTDPEISKKLTNETTELANLSNQIGSLSKQMLDVSAQRNAAQNELNQASAQKKSFETRLAQLRAAYEKEAKDAGALQEQLTVARTETKKLEADLALLDASHQDLQTQRQQVLAALQADRAENASLRERINAVSAEVTQLRPQIEKLKSEARHQKGLVAINKKQLATTESERDKLKTEADDLARGNEELARQVASSSSPVSSSANNNNNHNNNVQMASPALSTASANNPFFKRSASTDIAGTFSPPPGVVKPFSDKMYDDVFGPAFPASSSATPPPPVPTSFKQQDTGTSSASLTSFGTPLSSSTPGPGPGPALAPAALPRQPTLPVLDVPPVSSDARAITPSTLPLGGDVLESATTSTHVSPPTSRAVTAEPSPLPIAEAPDAASSVFAPPPPPPQPEVTPNGTSTPAALHFLQPQPQQQLAPVEMDATPKPAAPPFTAASPVAPAPASDDDVLKAKADFDNAFAAFTSANSSSSRLAAADKGKDVVAAAAASPALAAAPAVSAPAAASSSSSSSLAPAPAQQPWSLNREFPPISELERDDEDDDDSEDDESLKAGFDDDFTSASPPGPKSPPKSADGPKDAAKSAEVISPFAPFPASDKFVPPPPPAANSSGLDDIFAMPFPSQSTTAIGGASQFGPAASSSSLSAAPQQPQPPVVPAKTPLDLADDDDDFEGLEDAKEGSADDDFATISRSGLDDFSHVFDSSPPPSQTKSDASTTAGFGHDSSFDFAAVSQHSSAAGSGGGGAPLGPPPVAVASAVAAQSPPAAAVPLGALGGAPASASAALSSLVPPPAPPSAANSKDPDQHDWDAIFASFDGPVDLVAPPPGPPPGHAAANNSNAPPPAAAKDSAAARPTPLGRALTEDGVHDDPILKNLTAMGYSRLDALTALERYDYNLERAANFLANQSA